MDNHEEKMNLKSMQIKTLSGKKFVPLERFEQKKCAKTALEDRSKEQESLPHIFTEVTQPLKESLLAERIEVPLSGKKEQSGIRVVLGDGGSVKEILMANEFCKIFINKPTKTTTEESILAKFGRYGKIVDHKTFRNPQKTWGCVTYENAEAARIAVADTKMDESEVAVPEIRGGDDQYSKFKVIITWCRRKSKGIAYINVRGDVSEETKYRVLKVKEQELLILSNSNHSMFIPNLDSDITEDDIKKALVTSWGYGPDPINSVILVREEVGDTSQNWLASMKGRLQEQIEKCVAADRFSLKIIVPKEETASFYAVALFSNAEEGIDVCRNLSKRISINGNVVTMEHQVTSSLYVDKGVYKAVKHDLDTYIWECSYRGYFDVKISTKALKNGKIIIFINTTSKINLAKAMRAVQEILQGDVLECGSSPTLKYFFTRCGRSDLKYMAEIPGVHVQLDDRYFTIYIRGKQKNCSSLRNIMDDHLREIVKGEWKDIHLRDTDKPNGLMKALMIEYGIELEKFQKLTGLISVILNYKEHVVRMFGTNTVIDKANTMIGEMCSTLLTKVKINGREAEDDFPDCCICFSPVEPKELYRLEYCGHAYCISCVKMQTRHAIIHREFPIICGYDGCGCSLVWRDMSNMQRAGAFTLPILAKSSVSAFVLKNAKSFKYCLTPNCNMVYRVTSTGSVFVCPDCAMRICTTCHIQFHEGLTCSMYSSAKDVDDSHEEFLKTFSKAIQKCPTCGTPIEKAESCKSCMCYFCWLCLASFYTSDECCAHLSL